MAITAVLARLAVDTCALGTNVEGENEERDRVIAEKEEEIKDN